MRDLPLRSQDIDSMNGMDIDSSWMELLAEGRGEGTHCFSRTSTTFNDPNGLGSDEYRCV
jgi:hypothetical protein